MREPSASADLTSRRVHDRHGGPVRGHHTSEPSGSTHSQSGAKSTIDLCIQQAPSHFRYPTLERAWFSFGRSRRGSTTVEDLDHSLAERISFRSTSPGLRSTKCRPLVRTSVKAPVCPTEVTEQSQSRSVCQVWNYRRASAVRHDLQRKCPTRIDHTPPDRNRYGSPTR